MRNFINDQPVFSYIVHYKEENDGLSPTYREIMRACGISSQSVVSSILKRLEERYGLIELKPGKVAGIKVVGGHWQYGVIKNDIFY